jgi:hypothetical protein
MYEHLSILHMHFTSYVLSCSEADLKHRHMEYYFTTVEIQGHTVA